MDEKGKNKQTNSEAEQPKATAPSEETVNAANEEEQEERNGIIPEGMDFRKFIGCGG